MLYKIFVLTGLVAVVLSLTAREAERNPLEAYVLTDQSGQVVGNSGVRIGPLDLGMNSENQLKKYGLSNDLISRFQPFIGLTGPQAQQELKSNPLRINQAELQDIEEKFKAYWFKKYENAPSNIKDNSDVQNLYNLAKKNDWVPLLQQVDEFAQELKSGA